MIKTPYYACTELAELSHRTMAIFQYNACTWCRYRLCISAPSTHRRFVLSVAQALTSAVTPVNSDTFITYDVQQRYAPSETRFWRYDVWMWGFLRTLLTCLSEDCLVSASCRVCVRGRCLSFLVWGHFPGSNCLVRAHFRCLSCRVWGHFRCLNELLHGRALPWPRRTAQARSVMSSDMGRTLYAAWEHENQGLIAPTNVVSAAKLLHSE